MKTSLPLVGKRNYNILTGLHSDLDHIYNVYYYGACVWRELGPFLPPLHGSGDSRLPKKHLSSLSYLAGLTVISEASPCISAAVHIPCATGHPYSPTPCHLLSLPHSTSRSFHTRSSTQDCTLSARDTGMDGTCKGLPLTAGLLH